MADDDTTSTSPTQTAVTEQRVMTAPPWLPAVLGALLIFGAGYAVGESSGPDTPSVSPVADLQHAPEPGGTGNLPGGGSPGGVCPMPGGPGGQGGPGRHGGPGQSGPGDPRGEREDGSNEEDDDSSSSFD